MFTTFLLTIISFKRERLSIEAARLQAKHAEQTIELIKELTESDAKLLNMIQEQTKTMLVMKDTINALASQQP
jgi:hypothetical protein